VYDLYIRKAVENGKPIFSDFVLTDDEKEQLRLKGTNVESLESVKRVLTPLEYAGQYLNDPTDDDIVEFRREWIVKFDRTPELAKKLVGAPCVISVDPAFRQKQTNDFSGIVVTKKTDDNFVYVLEAKQLKVNPDKLIEEICRLVDVYKPKKVLVETVAAQLLLVNLLRNKMRETNKFFTIEEVRPNTTETKAIRIRSLIPYYANGQILHATGLSDLEGQLLEFPRGTHDDIIDALAYCSADWKSASKSTKGVSAKPFTWDWWQKRPAIGQNKNKQLKDLFGDLRNGR
jgi:predicted phage terminase large subunit-like protein